MEEKKIVINSDISDPREMYTVVYNTYVSLEDIQKDRLDWNIKGYPKDQVIADLKNILNLLEECGIKKPYIFGSIYIQAQNENSPIYISNIELCFLLVHEPTTKVQIIFNTSFRESFVLESFARNKNTGDIIESSYITAPTFSKFVNKFNEWLEDK